MGIILDQVVISTCNFCNMCCAHCLRGASNSRKMKHEYIDKLLENVDEIYTITFSGGEPSLNLDAITYTRHYCIEHDISVGSFFIATNGKNNPMPLMIEAIKWYAYCYEKEMCNITISQDMFHEEINPEHIDLMRGLSFYSETKKTDFRKVALVDEGNAKNLSGFMKVAVENHNEHLEISVYDDDISIEGTIYLTCDGEIRTNCDTAYDDVDFNIGNINENSLYEILMANYDEEAVS